MLKTSTSRRSVLSAAIGATLILLTPIAHANAKGRSTTASLITSTQGGGGTKSGAIVRDHRGQQNRSRPGKPICAGWFC